MSWHSPPPLDASFTPRPECYRCYRPRSACLCATIAPVANRTGVLILQHPRERFHHLGTARIARLGLDRVRVEPCAPWRPSPAPPAHVLQGAAVLYPAPGARELADLPPAERPRHLIVLDGTWFHARKLYDAHRWLHTLPGVCLTPAEPSRYRLRRQPNRHCVATLEAIVGALRILEPDTQGLDGLLASFVAMIDRQAAYEAAKPRDAAPPPRQEPLARAARAGR